jgi:hypothetical protein
MMSNRKLLIIHMGNTVKVLIFSLVFYTFVYYITLITAMVVTWELNQHSLLLDIICHIVAFCSTIITFVTYEPRKPRSGRNDTEGV